MGIGNCTLCLKNISLSLPLSLSVSLYLSFSSLATGGGAQPSEWLADRVLRREPAGRPPAAAPHGSGADPGSGGDLARSAHPSSQSIPPGPASPLTG